MAPEGLLSNADESDLAARIREFLGVGPYEEVIAVTPQFHRPEGGHPYWTPKNAGEFDKLKEAPDDILYDLKLRKWSEDAPTLWLFPGEWYDAIPEGYEIVDIRGDTKAFQKGKTDNDIRGGCLAYGFLKGNQP